MSEARIALRVDLAAVEVRARLAAQLRLLVNNGRPQTTQQAGPSAQVMSAQVENRPVAATERSDSQATVVRPPAVNVPLPAEKTKKRAELLEQEMQQLVGTFDGEASQWSIFRRKFDSIVRATGTDPLIQFRVLTTALSGRAPIVAGCFSEDVRRYERAWKKLCEFYDSAEEQLGAYLEELVRMRRFDERQELSVRRYVDFLGFVSRQMHDLELSAGEWPAAFMQQVVSQFSPAARAEWNMDPRRQTLRGLVRFLQDRLRMLSNIPTASTRAAAVQSASERVRAPSMEELLRMKCPQCDGLHALYRCPTFVAKPLGERLRLVNGWNLCENCLHEGHSADRCYLDACRVCAGTRMHNSALCPNTAGPAREGRVSTKIDRQYSRRFPHSSSANLKCEPGMLTMKSEVHVPSTLQQERNTSPAQEEPMDADVVSGFA